MRRFSSLTKFFLLISIMLVGYANAFCDEGTPPRESQSLDRARQLTTLIYKLYGIEDSPLLRENHPYDRTYRADYLAEGAEGAPNAYSYLWPFSGTLSAVNVLFEVTGDNVYLTMLEDRILPGLQQYYDHSRAPAGYASYVMNEGLSDRFYDDNIWLGIDFAELYLASHESRYLEMAKHIWDFVKSGEDDILGGGIYWCEQKKTSKNTCSNAPAAVFALRMFEATQDSTYFFDGKTWYDWTKRHLQDPADGLYWDNVNLEGSISKRKYPYNSGQMIQSAVLLYRFTGDDSYLREAQRIAESGYLYFFEDFTPPNGAPFRLLKRSDNWFIAVMMRGYAELYHADGNKRYLDAFRKSLDYAWNHARDPDGLFSKNWKHVDENGRKWLLDQAAMIEMYARISAFDNE